MCLKTVNALSDVGLVQMDEDGFLLKSTGKQIMICCTHLTNNVTMFKNVKLGLFHFQEISPTLAKLSCKQVLQNLVQKYAFKNDSTLLFSLFSHSM